MTQRRRQTAEPRLLVAAVMLVAVGTAQVASADGGTLRLSERSGDYQVSVFTSPTVLRAGAVDVSVLVQDVETGRVRDDVPVTIQIENLAQPALSIEREATSGAATNKLFRAAQFEASQMGQWRAQVLVGNRGESKPLQFAFDVAAGLPPWLELAPWLAWPLAVAGLFVVHQGLVTRRGRSSLDYGTGDVVADGTERSRGFA